MSESTGVMNQAASAPVVLAGKYLTFRLAGEEYGIEILKVQEIIGMMAITQIPRTPASVRGVINLRGKVIPIVDLRVKFAMERAEETEKTCIIVVQVRSAAGTVTMGFIVDEVCEVLDIAADEIEEAPRFGTGIDTAYIMGMAKLKGSVKILVDIDKVLGAAEMEQLKERTQQAAGNGTTESDTDRGTES